MRTDIFMIVLQVLQIFRSISLGDTRDPLQEKYGVLKHASILQRHGDRSPISTFPLDPHKDYPWLDGYGQLQNKGKIRMVDEGKWFRTRYQDFINDTYTRHETHVDSSSLDRCVMSALCFLYGFYPAVGVQIWIPNETWQPIPVYPIAKHDDNKLLLSKNCPLKTLLAKKEATDPKYANTYNEYETVIKSIIKVTGINVQHKTKAQIFTLLDHLSDTLRVYRQNGLSLPKWANDTIPLLETILRKTRRKFNFDVKLARLKSGPFLGSVIGDMRQKITDKEYRQKLHIYSAHDRTIWTVMTALKVYDNVLPAYGSSLIFELRKKNSTNYVTISYRNDTNAPDARLLRIPGCELSCTFKQFHELVSPLIPQHWDKECESPDWQEIILKAIILSVFMHLIFMRNHLLRFSREPSRNMRLRQRIFFSFRTIQRKM